MKKAYKFLTLGLAALLASCGSAGGSTSGSGSATPSTSGSTSPSISGSVTPSVEPTYDFQPLKIGIFADVQLGCQNLGSTANAKLALKNQLAFSKAQNVDVLIIDGDLVNNALPTTAQSTDEEAIYKIYDEALKEVYGTDESKYPEFIQVMGNHEWWDQEEHPYKEAAKRFRKYAHIQTENLVKESQIPLTSEWPTHIDYGTNVVNYYKVVKGIPFVGISSEFCDGTISDEQKTELKGWFQEIAKLPSVVAGGPIYVAYHYPIKNTTYQFGQGSNNTTVVLDDILKDYPQTILFTGDTHYSAVNERTIWQKYYTTINIGSSSYSRSVNRSGDVDVMGDEEKFYNVPNETITDDAGYKSEYATQYQIVNIDNKGNSKISRYLTADQVENSRKIGVDWNIPVKISKNDFAYGLNRIGNKEFSKSLYGANGVSFNQGAQATYKVDAKGNLLVNFPDVNEFNSVEHYRINVNGTKKFEFVSQYYKYDENGHENHYVINKDDLPTGPITSVVVTAYDFYDNVSLNSLTATTSSEVKAHESIDYKLNQTYADISHKLNYEDTAPNSASSLEYYYRGIHEYNYGALLNRIVEVDAGKSPVSAIDEISLTDTGRPLLTFKAKNPNDQAVTIGVLCASTNGGWHEWDKDYNFTVPAHSGWIEKTYELDSLFGANKKSELLNVALKARYEGQNTSGYEFTLLLDDVDIKDNPHSIDPQDKAIIQPYSDIKKQLVYSPTASASSGTAIEYSYDSSVSPYNYGAMLSTLIRGGEEKTKAAENDYGAVWSIDNWKYSELVFKAKNPNAEAIKFGLRYESIDGSVSIDFGSSVCKELPGNSDWTEMRFPLYSMCSVKSKTDIKVLTLKARYLGSGVNNFFIDDLDIVTATEIIRGKTFAPGSDSTISFSSKTTKTLNIDFKFPSDATDEDKIWVFLHPESWDYGVGYFGIDKYGNLKDANQTVITAADGLSTTILDDGYIRVTYDFNKLALYENATVIHGDVANLDYTSIHFRNWTSVSGYFDFNPAI